MSCKRMFISNVVCAVIETNFAHKLLSYLITCLERFLVCESLNLYYTVKSTHGTSPMLFLFNFSNLHYFNLERFFIILFYFVCLLQQYI